MNAENRRAYIWNTASGVISAAQSAVILIFISRYLGVAEAGTFTIAYAIANLIGVFAKYGVRNFQVTDIEGQYAFSTYFLARIASVFGSIVFLAIYLLIQIEWQKYTAEKAVVIFAVCIWKLIDAAEDVFIGAYQGNGKLSVGACYYTLRLLVSTIIYCGLIVCGLNLVYATSVTVLVSSLVCICFAAVSFGKFNMPGNFVDGKSLLRLLKVCFPLCIGSTLANYVGNAPKYTIDQHMNDSSQAYFGYIMMPAFIILLFSNFIYQPLVRNLGVLWEKGEPDKFLRMVFRQFVMVLGITVLTVAVGSCIGIPVLSFVYGVDLFFLKQEFLLLMAGGGAYALVSYLMVILTTIRMQNQLAVGFIIVSSLYYILGGLFVSRWDILGVVLLYLILNVILVLGFTACMFFKVKRRR